MVKSLGYVLTLGTQDAWRDFLTLLKLHLTPKERAALAFISLKSLDENDAVLTAEAAIHEGAGQPIAPLFDHVDEAAFWADMANSAELLAYCMASYSAMPPEDQAAFLDHVKVRRAG